MGRCRDLPEHPVPAGELTVLMDMVPKSLVSVISSSKPSDIENFGLFRSPANRRWSLS